MWFCQGVQGVPATASRCSRCPCYCLQVFKVSLLLPPGVQGVPATASRSSVKAHAALKAPIHGAIWSYDHRTDLVGSNQIGSMAVMAYSAGIQKILAMSKLSDGNAEPTAVVIGEVLTEWNLKDRIAPVCFDTTAVNTGDKSGVCLCLELMLDKPLLYFVCRHQILEILLDKVFSSLFKEQSKGPEVSLFLDFRNMWPQIDQTKLYTAMNDETIMLRV
ncbi:hypothetical protein GWK47_024348 [Chionoecetes opilio]|uniref:Uncharacterized protein n=1 Tax=Chionoecetes opilio TaxID=41210 RepID=A0A8J4XVH4_CHIOP|nr:hypothetical protein GWK47_024348 [Chionoecetes opilio]